MTILALKLCHNWHNSSFCTLFLDLYAFITFERVLPCLTNQNCANQFRIVSWFDLHVPSLNWFNYETVRRTILQLKGDWQWPWHFRGRLWEGQIILFPFSFIERQPETTASILSPFKKHCTILGKTMSAMSGVCHDFRWLQGMRPPKSVNIQIWALRLPSTGRTWCDFWCFFRTIWEINKKIGLQNNSTTSFIYDCFISVQVSYCFVNFTQLFFTSWHVAPFDFLVKDMANWMNIMILNLKNMFCTCRRGAFNERIALNTLKHLWFQQNGTFLAPSGPSVWVTSGYHVALWWPRFWWVFKFRFPWRSAFCNQRDGWHDDRHQDSRVRCISAAERSTFVQLVGLESVMEWNWGIIALLRGLDAIDSVVDWTLLIVLPSGNLTQLWKISTSTGESSISAQFVITMSLCQFTGGYLISLLSRSWVCDILALRTGMESWWALRPLHAKLEQRYLQVAQQIALEAGGCKQRR